jgi:2,3-bisphosphoglycerate-independent phosphoglycerate mutase
MILLDGVGDRSYPELNHLTPLQAARTPFIDQLVRDGASGLYHAGLLGQALPSENAHFAIFGYDMQEFPGRGALEALGAGIPMDSGEVAILAHFVTVELSSDGTLVLVDGKPEASDEEITALIKSVGKYSADGVQVQLHHTHGYRGIVTLSGPGDVAPFITDSDPLFEGRPVAAVVPWADFANKKAPIKTSKILGSYLEWIHHTLHDHPVNIARQIEGRRMLNGLVTQRAGRLKRVTPFTKRWGLRGLSIASGLIYHGLAGYLGMDVCKVADTPHPGRDLAKRLESALAALSDHDFIHVHTKMPDQAAHTKDPSHKTQILELLDQGIGTVLKALTAQPELLIVIAADHSTPSAGPLIHSGEAVPLVFFGPGIRRDRVRHYDEVGAAAGALGPVRGKELMYLILNHLDRAKLQGLMDTPVDQPYWPGGAKRFRVQAPQRAGVKK